MKQLSILPHSPQSCTYEHIYVEAVKAYFRNHRIDSSDEEFQKHLQVMEEMCLKFEEIAFSFEKTICYARKDMKRPVAVYDICLSYHGSSLHYNNVWCSPKHDLTKRECVGICLDVAMMCREDTLDDYLNSQFGQPDISQQKKATLYENNREVIRWLDMVFGGQYNVSHMYYLLDFCK